MAAHAEAIHFARARRPVLAYWHLLSLDAPTIAAVWCMAFAQAVGVRLPWYSPAALAVAAWVLYVADRLLDVRLLDVRHGRNGRSLRDRHWFHAKHEARLLPLLLAGTLFLAWVVLARMQQRVVAENAALGCVALLYFARVHLGAKFDWKPLVVPRKEFLVGTIFAIAVAIPTLARTSRPSPFAVPVLGFAALCCLNCLVIESAENETPMRHVRFLPLTLAVLCLAGILLPGAQPALLICIAASAVLLEVLCRKSGRLSPLAFRISADAALLTPLLFLPWHRSW